MERGIDDEKNSAVGDKWIDWEKGVFTPEEDAACELRFAQIGEIIKARQEGGLSQSELDTKMMEGDDQDEQDIWVYQNLNQTTEH